MKGVPHLIETTVGLTVGTAACSCTGLGVQSASILRPTPMLLISVQFPPHGLCSTRSAAKEPLLVVVSIDSVHAGLRLAVL